MPPNRLAAKEVLGVGVVVAIVLVAATSLRLYAEGPDWGLQLEETQNGGVVAHEVRGHGVAWEQHIRTGDRVLTIDGVDAHNFIGQQVGGAREIVVADANGSVRTVRPPDLPEALKLWLPGVAVLFALLGAVVHRWSLDPPLARTFLVFGATTAASLASMAGGLRGYTLMHFLAASSSVVASAAFTTLFVWFPRPVRGARWFTNVLAAVSASLVLALVVFYGRGEGTPAPLEMSLFVWMGGNLLIGMLVLAWRAVQPSDRHVLAPLALGIGVGIFPLALLDALPQALGRQPIMWADSASASVVAIPLAFAYSILRHRLFALDAHVRRFVFHLCAALVLVAMFIPSWFILRAIGMDDQLAVVAGVLMLALAAPTVFDRTQSVLERVFYPPLGLARAGLMEEDSVASASSIADAFAVRAREFVPTRWTALIVHETARVREGPGWAVLGFDGDVPSAWPQADQLVSLVSLAQDVPGLTIVRMDRSPSLSVAVCLGPRLDGAPPGGVDIETIRLLASRVLPLIEAALLRERTQANSRFREGLWELARELAAVGPESDVLRVTAEHAARLLRAYKATVLVRQTPDGQTYLPVEGLPELSSPEELEGVVQLDLAAGQEVARGGSGYVSYLHVPDSHSMLVCWLGAAQPSEALLVLVRPSPFGDEDARHAVEIAEHVDGALRRARMSAEAAEARALREIDRLRNELLATIAHEIRNPLTSVLAYAQMLQQKAETLSRQQVTRMATQIEYSAAATRDIVRDLSTATLQMSGRLEMRVRSVELSAAISTIARSFQVLPGGERIAVDVPAGVCAQADPGRLDQMIGNLLLNAMNYARSGPIVVSARVASPSTVWIEVRDEGPGIAHDAQQRIWDRLYRVADGEPEAQGTGIGLAVVRSLAELQGGRVELDSSPGSGSTFRIILPRAT